MGGGKGFASPVPPFAGEVERFPDKPGARPLTWSSPRRRLGERKQLSRIYQGGVKNISQYYLGHSLEPQANGQEVKDMYRLAGTCTSPILPVV